MRGLDLVLAKSEPLRLLCLGAHCDDVEIGCGATILHLCARRPVDVHWVVFASNPAREKEARRAADRFLSAARSQTVIVHEHRDGFLPYRGEAVKDDFEALKALVDPDLVLTHSREDLHQDHRLVNELTGNTFRDHLVMEYEIPKYDGDLGRPGAYVPVSRETLDEKIDILFDCYASQANKRWFDPELFRALPRLRGMECNSPTGFAEAFTIRKQRLFVDEDA